MYLLDTNVLYDVADAPFAEHVARFCERGADGSLELRFSPVAIIEAASRLVREPARFDQLKRGAQIFRDARARSLPDPEQRMREILYDGDVARSLYSHWDDILDTLSRAPDVDSFRRGYDDIASATRRAVDIGHVHSFREEYERQFVVDMYALAVRFNPRYEKQCLRSKPARLTETERAALDTFLAAEEWNTAFRDMLGARADAPVPTDPGRRGVVDDKAAFFRKGYEWIVRKLFHDGRHVKYDDKNDYNDMHLLLHVNRFTADLIVTSDAVQSVVADVGGTKVLTLRAFAAAQLA